MSKRRKPQRRNPAMSPAVAKGRITAELRERERLRVLQRQTLFELEPAAEAFSELLDLYATLSETDGIDPELANLLKDARQWIADGVDRLISSEDPHDLDETRLLLEMEFLFRDFAATPEHIAEWAKVEEWKRPAKFGFGKLRQREEQRRGLDAAMVVASRDHWITHSTPSHPQPLKDKAPPLHHFSFSLLCSAGDLVDHALTTLETAVLCIEATGAEPSDEFFQLSTGACQEFSTKAQRIMTSHIPADEAAKITTPRPKKQTQKKYWQAET